MIKQFLFKTDNINRSSYIWNMTGGIINALQSILLLAIISRVVGVYDAGVFSIAWAIAYLAITLGNYGMRPYQVTDADNKYTAEQYIASRIVTCGLMILFCAVYIIYGTKCLDYSKYKCEVIMLITAWKIIESYEDVYHGWFQKCGRLDVAAKAVTIRYMVGIIAFTITILATRNLVASLIATVAVSLLVFYTLTFKQSTEFCEVGRIKIEKGVGSLLLECIMLCVVSFLTIYIANAPKYAIDVYLDETTQAYYNYLFMPVFAIWLLASFVFNPVLKNLAEAWSSGDKGTVKRIIVMQIAVTLIISAMALTVAYYIGIPMLETMFGADLSQFRRELIILLCGGCMIALANFAMLTIATFRKQNLLIVGFGSSALFALIASKKLVSAKGITGASWTYTISTGILAIILIIILVFVYARGKSNNG